MILQGEDNKNSARRENVSNSINNEGEDIASSRHDEDSVAVQ